MFTGSFSRVVPSEGAAGRREAAENSPILK
jgi:hypothetical protein